MNQLRLAGRWILGNRRSAEGNMPLVGRSAGLDLLGT